MEFVGARVLAWLRGEEASDILVARAARGDVTGVETLLDSNVSPNEKARCSGLTALYVAVQSGHRDVVWLLLQRGANVNVEMPDGDCALARAATMGDGDICQKLLVYGASPHQLGAEGMSPLVLAARGGHLTVMRALLARGANPSLATIGTKTKRGFVGVTPLFVAVLEGQLEAAELLISAGARDERALAAARANVAHASQNKNNKNKSNAHAEQMLRVLLPRYSETG